MADGAPKTTAKKGLPAGFAAQVGKGRPKGVPNKSTVKVKEAVLAALEQAGGVDYLAKQANANPAAFLSLIGKVIPLQIAGDQDSPLRTVTEIRIVGVEA